MKEVLARSKQILYVGFWPLFSLAQMITHFEVSDHILKSVKFIMWPDICNVVGHLPPTWSPARLICSVYEQTTMIVSFLIDLFLLVKAFYLITGTVMPLMISFPFIDFAFFPSA